MKNSIMVIGHFGGNKKFNDGQTIKTKSLYEALLKTEYSSVKRIDTYFIKKNPFRFFTKFLMSLLDTKTYIVLLSANGRKVLFPILYLMEKYLHKNVINYGIGGRLAREVGEKRTWKKYVLSFHGNWMESQKIVDGLAAQGINNAMYIPNFKNLTTMTASDLKQEYSVPYRFVMFSRVNKEKGVEDAIGAIQYLNNKHDCMIATLDIYGSIESGYEKTFEELLKNADSCNYCGVVEANKSVETLKDYYVLLFPTHWRHEGIPGTIIDALSAGVPVISRRWQYCDDMITDHYNGYVYEYDTPEKLKELMEHAICSPEEVWEMRKNCLKKAYEYSEQYVIGIITKELQKLEG